MIPFLKYGLLFAFHEHNLHPSPDFGRSWKSCSRFTNKILRKSHLGFQDSCSRFTNEIPKESQNLRNFRIPVRVSLMDFTTYPKISISQCAFAFHEQNSIMIQRIHTFLWKSLLAFHEQIPLESQNR